MRLEDHSWPQVRQAAANAVVVLPVAAIEQHGPHLGVGTDTALVTAVAQQAEARRPGQIILCPTLPFGMSDHHRSYAGTISISPQTYSQVLVDAVESILAWPATRVCILNGHGGNIAPGKQALAILMSRRKTDIAQITFTTYFELAGKAWAGDPPMQSPAVSHACEYETSAMMHVRPQAVHMDLHRPRTRTHHNPYIGWEDDQPNLGVSMMAATEFITDTGVMGGDPALATVEKGRHLVDRAVDGLVAFIDSFITWQPMKDMRHAQD